MARQQLDALRVALTVRLSRLEAVLADPGHGESLEILILDLARVATQEAQAAAALACMDTKRQADKQLAHLKSSAQAAIEREQATISQLRHAVEQAQQRIATLEQEKQNELRTLRELSDAALLRERGKTAGAERALQEAQRASGAETQRLTARVAEVSTALEREAAQGQAVQKELRADLARAREAADLAERARGEMQSPFETERAAGRQLRQELERARGRSSTLERENAQAHAANAELTTELTRAREAAADSERALADAHSQLNAERAAGSQLRQELESASELAAALQGKQAEAETAHDELGRELARVRDAVAAAEMALAKTRSELESERASSAELRRAVERANERNSSLGQEQALAQAAHHELMTELARLRDAVAASQAGLEDARSEIEEERASGAELRRIMKRAKEMLKTLGDQNAAMQAREQELAAELARAQEAVAQSERERAVAEAQLEFERACHAELREGPESQQPPEGAGSNERVAQVDLSSSDTDLEILAADSDFDAGWQTVRLANRYAFPQPIDILVDGDPGLLFDLSIAGCQLLSPARLKPNHAIKIVLSSGDTTIPCAGKVVWARLELASAGRVLGCRAGVQFTKPDEEAIEAFVIRHAPA